MMLARICPARGTSLVGPSHHLLRLRCWSEADMTEIYEYAPKLVPHLTFTVKLAGRHFEAGQKLDIALIASSAALADAGVLV
jgi:hypothetical protein